MPVHVTVAVAVGRRVVHVHRHFDPFLGEESTEAAGAHLLGAGDLGVRPQGGPHLRERVLERGAVKPSRWQGSPLPWSRGGAAGPAPRRTAPAGGAPLSWSAAAMPAGSGPS